MKSAVISLALGTAFAAVPAEAQYRAPTPPPAQQAPRPQQQEQQQEEVTQAPAEQGGVSVSKGAFKAISELKAAVDAKDTANIPARLAAAEAVARTTDDHYMVDLLRLRGAAVLNDPAAIEQALARILPSGKIPNATAASVHADVGALYGQRKQYEQAAAAFERSLAIEPNNLQRILMLAEARNSQGRAADAVSLLRKAIGQARAAGQKAEENWYKRSVAIAYAAKLPNTVDLTREWLTAYPTQQNWRDTLQVYRQSHQLDEASSLDLYRLARAAKALRGETDYYSYAEMLLLKGFPGEAKAVLDEALAANAIDRGKPEFAQQISSANTRSAGDRASLADSAKSALAAPAAKQAVAVGDAYYGYGDYSQAASLYKAALGKSGADADLINLRLGMALARAGDKAGATAAFRAVTGSRSEIASFWLIYLSTAA